MTKEGPKYVEGIPERVADFEQVKRANRVFEEDLLRRAYPRSQQTRENFEERRIQALNALRTIRTLFAQSMNNWHSWKSDPSRNQTGMTDDYMATLLRRDWREETEKIGRAFGEDAVVAAASDFKNEQKAPQHEQ